MFSVHKALKLEINFKKKVGKATDSWSNNVLLKNDWVKEEIKEEIKRFVENPGQCGSAGWSVVL